MPSIDWNWFENRPKYDEKKEDAAMESILIQVIK